MSDVVIVGAGTAGCVLAERLSRSGRWRVKLIEAGGPPTNRFVSVPAGFTKLFKSEVDWAFESEPQAAVGGRRIFTPRGKMLGGSSNMNAMMHQWCHPADFEGWVAAGAAGWGWADVAPVFRALERWGGDGCDGRAGGAQADDARGREGPMRIEPNRNARALSHHFVAAARRVGLGDAPGYNGTAYRGAWIAELAHWRGKRFSVYDACLKPAMKRANLEVLTHAQVSGITIDAGRANGVTTLRGGREETHPARAVVLAAGAYASPQLLMLSGIGPEQSLRGLGIDVRVHAPEVGENLQDHPTLPIAFRTSSTDTLLAAETLPQLARYLLLGRGMLASNGVEAFAFTRVGPGPADAPDLELMMLPVDAHSEFLANPREHAFVIAPAVVAPRSRGRLRLRGRTAGTPMSIDPALLSDPEGLDARVLWEGVRLARRIASTPPLAAWNAGEMRPGPMAQSESEFVAYARETLQTVYHPTSTCRMGSDASAVVDPQLRVRGVRALWLADASVMPAVPRGHPNAVVAMIGLRAAEWVEASLA